jgi:hypothetical protein
VGWSLIFTRRVRVVDTSGCARAYSPGHERRAPPRLLPRRGLRQWKTPGAWSVGAPFVASVLSLAFLL